MNQCTNCGKELKDTGHICFELPNVDGFQEERDKIKAVVREMVRDGELEIEFSIGEYEAHTYKVFPVRLSHAQTNKA